ncbi:MAG: MlaD family protein [bacterium]|nr:MlaD family protein [bacterium]
MSRRKNDILIGFITFLAVIIIFYSIFHVIKISKHKDYYRIYAKTENVSGIELGTKIYLQGFEIGKVSEIRLNQDNDQVSFLIVMLIKKEIILYEGTRAVISGLGVFGDSSLEIEFPENRDKILSGEGYIEIEEDIGIKELVADVKGTIKEVDKFIKEDLKNGTEEAREFINQLSTVISDNSDSFNQSIVLLNKDLQEFHEAVSTVNKLIGRNEKTINELLENIHTSSGHLKVITEDINKMSKTTTEELNKVAINLAITSKNFAVVSEDIKKHPWKLLWKKDTDIEKAVEELEDSIEKEKDKYEDEENPSPENTEE